MGTGGDSGGSVVPNGSCTGCGTPFAGDQRYCLRCGARRDELPAAVAGTIAAFARADRAAAAPPPPPEPAPAAAAAQPAAGAAAAAGAAEGGIWNGYLPSPRAAAIAVLGMLGLGVLLGSATSQIARSAGIAPIIVVSEPPPPEAAPPPVEEEEEVESQAPAEEVAAAPIQPLAEEALPEEPLPEAPSEPESQPPLELPEIDEPEPLPEIDHVFVVVLGDNGFEETFGERSNSTYLSQTLPEEGALLANYFAVASGSLANQIGLLSGQGPTPETALDCPNYGDLLPGTISAEGQAEGNGCVYPAAAETLVSQLGEAKKTWRAYVEGMAAGAAAGQPTACRHPLLGTPDPGQVPLPGDAYETWRNPFVYFHSIVDSPACEEDDIDLERLATDLAKAKTTPNLAYIVPDACHAGGEAPCEEGAPTGALAAGEFLEAVVPEIVESPAYEEGRSLIAITSAQAPQLGAHADASSCCGTPEYPNMPPREEAEAAPGPVKPNGGGGRVGLLLISPYVKPGTVEESGYYNHYTLLATIEQLFELPLLGYASEQLSFAETVLTASGEEEEGGGGEGEPTVTERTRHRHGLRAALSRALSAVR